MKVKSENEVSCVRPSATQRTAAYQSPYYQPIWEYDEINEWISFTEEWKEAHMRNIIYKQIFTDQRARIRTPSQARPELTGLPSVMSVLLHFILCLQYPFFFVFSTTKLLLLLQI